MLPALEERFTVLAIDRRGRGQSGDAGDYALEREYEDVVTVVEWAGQTVNLLGHSHGGLCALEAALLTDRIGKLVLYEPPLGFLVSPPEVVRQLQALLHAGERDELLACFMREVADLPLEQIELLRSLPAWEARLGAAHTIPRKERVNREYVFDPVASASCAYRRRSSRAATAPTPSERPARRCGRRFRTVASSSWRGSDTPRWTSAPSCSRPKC